MVRTINIAVLVTRAQRGDREAFGELSEHFRPSLYALAYARLRNAHEAQELIQDVFMHALEKLCQLRQPAAFPGWIRRMTVRMAINRITRRGSARAADPEFIQSSAGQSVTPLEILIHSEQVDRVRTGLARLKPTDRDTLVAFYFRGQSLDQISRQARAPLGTIKRRLHVARNRLRDELESDTRFAERSDALNVQLVGVTA